MPNLTVSSSEAGQRLDRYLKKILPGMPIGHIYKRRRNKNWITKIFILRFGMG